MDILEDLDVMEVDIKFEDALLGPEDPEEKMEIEEKTKNPVKKYQFLYDESLCMVDKYPEINVAPGEGQRPKSVCVSRQELGHKGFPTVAQLG